MDINQTTVLIVDDEPITRMDLRELLESKGYRVVEEAADGFDAVTACRKHHPVLVLMDIKMPLLDGLSASRIICEEQLADTVLLLTAYNEREYIESAKTYGIGGYLVKPVDEKALIPGIELAVARSQELKKLKTDIKKVSERLENRGIIERAKGQIMKMRNLSELEAYNFIRKLSQDKNISMRKVAEYILVKVSD